jgi:predicted NAD-dependent protein-ADP-ribosyltransferase YbiA (DUF1768 family)
MQDPIVNLSGSPEVPDLVNANGSARPVSNNVQAEYNPLNDTSLNYISAPTRSYDASSVTMEEAAPFRTGRYNNVLYGYNNEDAAAQRQGWTSKMVNGVGKGLLLTGTTFVQSTAGLLNGLYQMVDDGRFASFYDNDFNRKIDEITKAAEDILPNYYSDAEKNSRWYSPSKLFSANFLWDGIVKNLGFAAGAALSGGVFATGLKSLSLLPGLAKLVSIGKGAEVLAASTEEAVAAAATAGKVAEGYGKLKAISNQFLGSYKTLNAGNRAVVAGLATTGEAGFEAFNNLNQFRDDKIEEYKNTHGGLDPIGAELDKINKASESVGNSSFLANVALLSVTNYIQFPKILGSSYRAEKDIINGVSRKIGEVTTDTTGKFIEKAVTGNKFLSALNKIRPYTFSVPEGFEEGAQYAIQIGTQDYYDKKYDNSATSAIGSIFEGIKETVGTDEGMENILIGGLSGALMLGRGRYKENSAKDINTKAAIESFNKSKLSDFTSDTIDSVNRGTVLQEDREELLKAGKITDSKDKEADYIINYLSPRIKYGRFDLVRSDIAEYRTLASTEEGFAQLQAEGKALASDTREAYLTRLAKFEATAENTKSLYQSLNLRYGGKVDVDKNPMYTSAVMDKMVYAAAKVADYDDRLPSVEATLVNAGIDIGTVNADLITGNFESYNAAMEKVKTLDSTIQEDVGEALYSVGQMTVRRNLFLQEYTDIKNNPKEYTSKEEKEALEKKASIAAVPPTSEPTAPEIEKTNITIRTKFGETTYQTNTEYILGKVSTFNTNGDEIIHLPRLTILKDNGDKTIDVQDSKGNVKTIEKTELESYNLTPSSRLATDKKFKFFHDNRNMLYYHHGIKLKNGKSAVGRLRFSGKKGKLIFAYVDDKGVVQEKEIWNTLFKAKPGFHQGMVAPINILTEDQQKSEKAFVEDNTTVSDSLQMRNDVIADLYEKSLDRLAKVRKDLEQARDKISKSQEILTEKSTALDNENSKKRRSIKKINAIKNELAVLSETHNKLTIELAQLENEKEELEAVLPNFLNFIADLENLPDDVTDIINILKGDIDTIDQTINNVKDSITQTTTLLKDIEDTLVRALSLFNDYIKRLKEENPNVPLFIEDFQDRIEKIYGEEGAKQFIAERLGFTETVIELQSNIADFQNELRIPEFTNKLEKVTDELKSLDTQLNDLINLQLAKQELLESFKEVIEKQKKEEEESEQLQKNESLKHAYIGTHELSIQNFITGTQYEPASKKDNKAVVRGTRPIAKGKDHQVRANNFGFNFPKFTKKVQEKIKGIVVTFNTEDQILKGLSDHLLAGLTDAEKEKYKKEELVALVLVQDNGDGTFTLINEKGKPISKTKTGKYINPLNLAIYQTFPMGDLMGSYPDKNNPKIFTRQSMFREDINPDLKTRLEKEYTAWRINQLSQKTLGGLHEIKVSFGIPEYVGEMRRDEKTGKEYFDRDTSARVPVQKSGLITDNDLKEKQVVTVATTNDDITEGGVTFKTPRGRVFLKIANFGIAKLFNRKFNESEASVIFDVIHQISKEGATSGKMTPETKKLIEWLKTVVYWGIAKDRFTNERKPAGYNNVWFETVKTEDGGDVTKLFISGISNTPTQGFTFTPMSLQDNKRDIIYLLTQLYHNTNAHRVNEGSWKKPYIQIIGIDKTGTLITKKWSNYQTYLLSDKSPDSEGNLTIARNVDDIPLVTQHRPLKNAEDVNRHSIYFTLNSPTTDFDFTEPAPTPTVETPTPTSKVVTAPTAAPATTTPAASNQGAFAASGAFIFDGLTINIITTTYGKIYFRFNSKTNEINYVNYDDSIIDQLKLPVNEGGYGLTTDAEIEKSIQGSIQRRILQHLENAAVPEASPIIDAPTVTPAVSVDEDVAAKLANIIVDDEGQVPPIDDDEWNEPGGQDNKAYRLEIVENYKNFKREDWSKLEEWFKTHFKNIPIYRVKNIIQATNGKQAWGMLHKGAIYLYENAEVGTAYHEVFEAVWKMFAGPTDKQLIIDEFRNRKGSYTDRFNKDDSGKPIVIKYSKATPEQIKEEIAEEFREFILSGKTVATTQKGKSLISTLFHDIINFFNTYFFGKSARLNTQKLFDKIGNGYYNEFNPYASKLNYAETGIIDIEDMQGDTTSEFSKVKNIPALQVHEVIQHMTFHVLRSLTRTNQDLFSIPNLNKTELYSNLKKQVELTIRSKRDAYVALSKNGEIPEEEANFKINNLKYLYGQFQSNWNDIILKHEDYLKKFNIEFDENDELALDEDKGKEDPYGNARQIDTFRKANSAIKLLFGSLPYVKRITTRDTTGKEISTTITQSSSFGGVTLLPADKVNIELLNKLHDSVDLNEMLTRLQKLAIDNPNYEALYYRLTKSESSNAVDYDTLKDHDWHLINAFWKAMKKQNADVITVFILPAGDIVISDSALSSATKQAKRTLSNSMISKIKKTNNKDDSGTKYFTYNDRTGKYTVTPLAKNIKFSSSQLEGYIKFLSELGIDFTMDDLDKLDTIEHRTKLNIFRNAVEGIQLSISKLEPILENGKVKTDAEGHPIDFSISSISSRTLDIDKNLMQLATIKAVLENPEFESTYFNLNGDRTQTYVGTNALSNLHHVLSKLENINELTDDIRGYSEFKFLLTDKFAKGSILLQRMFNLSDDGSGNRISGTEYILKPVFIDGTVNEQNGKKKESSKQTYKQRLIQELNLNIDGVYLNLVPGDASMEHASRLHDRENPFVTSDDYDNKEYLEIFKDYFMSEVELSRDDRRVVGKNKSTDLRFFKAILADNSKTKDEDINRLHNKIINTSKKVSSQKLYKDNKKEIDAAVEKFIKQEGDDVYALLTAFEIIKETEEGITVENLLLTEGLELTETALREKLNILSINYIIANIEFHKIVYSDPYQYSDELKRIKNFLSPREPLMHGSATVMSAINTQYNQDYLETENDLGYSDMNRDHFRSITLADLFSYDDTIQDYSNAYEEPEGGGYIVMKGLRLFRILGGTWSDDNERQYKYDVAWEKRKKAEIAKAAGNITLATTLYDSISLKEIDLLDRGNPNIRDTYTPIKPIVSGNKNNGRDYNDVVLHKFALVPISYRVMYELNPNSNMLKLYDKMETEQVDYAVYESGSKVGTEKLTRLYDDKGNFNTAPIQTPEELLDPYSEQAISNIPYSIVSVQTEVPSKDTPKVTQGSQITKLVTLDFMDAGVPIDFHIKDNKGNLITDFDQRFIAWTALKTDAEKFEQSSLYKEIKNNQKLLEAKIENGYYSLLKKLGIKKTDDGFVLFDKARLINTLKDEILKREVNDNILDAFDGFKKGDVVLEATPAYQQIRNILYSIADHNVVRPKISGGMKVQIPSTLLESVRAVPVIKKTRKGKEVLGYSSDVLKFYEDVDGKRYCEIMIGRWFSSTKTDKELIEYFNNTKEGQAQMAALAGVAFRIPTQKQNSIDAFRIKQFLPTEFGDSVVIPSALVNKSGSDFDIDKLSIYLKNVITGKNGFPEVIKLLTDENSTIEKRYTKWVTSVSDRDVSKYVHFLNKGIIKELRSNFKNELVEISKKYKSEVSLEKTKAYEELVNLYENDLKKNLAHSDQELYLEELFDVGRSVFFRLSPTTRVDYFELKQELKEQKIEGPAEIEQYLALTISKLWSNQNPKDAEELTNLAKIYEEELRAIGIATDYINEYKTKALAAFREKKTTAIREVIDIINRVREGITYDYYVEKDELELLAAKEMAEMDELLSIEEFAKLSILQQNTKEALENSYIESLENLISHPLNFANLVKPNSAEQMKVLSKTINTKLGIAEKDYSSVGNMLNRRFMTGLRQAFVGGRYAIGIAAVAQTNHAQNQRAVTFLDPSRLATINIPDSDKTILGYNKDAKSYATDSNINFAEYNSIKINGIKKPTLSKIKDALGINFISDIIGQFIDGYVDISKGPWIMDLGATPNVAGTWLFLIKLGVPINSVAYFMNQPIIREYLQKIDNKGYSWLFIGTFVDQMLLKYKTNATFNETGTVVTTIPGETLLGNNVGKALSEMSELEKAEQQYMLKEFLKYAKMASHLFDVTQGSNFDTANLNDPYLIFKKLLQWKKAQNTMISSVDDLMENSFVAFLKTAMLNVRDAFTTILISDSNKTDGTRASVRDVIETVLTPYISINDRDFIRLSQKAVNDLFDWAVQTNTQLNNKIANILLGVKDPATKQILIDSAAVEIMKFKESILGNKSGTIKAQENHPLYNNIILRSIDIEVGGKENKVNNIYITGRDNKVYDQNLIIYGFEELKKNLTDNNNLELYTKLVSLAVIQSGLTNSKIAFTNLLPYDDFKEIYNETLSELENMSNLADFAKLNVFERNNWNNDDVAPFLKDELTKSKSGRYYYKNQFFVNEGLRKASEKGLLPKLIRISTASFEGRSDFMVYSWEDKIGSAERIRRRKSDNKSHIHKVLMKKVYIETKQGRKPLIQITESNGSLYYSYVYKAINAWGDSFKAQEFYDKLNPNDGNSTIGPASVIDNGFDKVQKTLDQYGRQTSSNEMEDIDIISYYTGDIYGMTKDEFSNIESIVQSPSIIPTQSNNINIYAGTNENADLSNFAERPVRIGGMNYKNVESAFQHTKLTFSNPLTTQPIAIQEAQWFNLTGKEAKALGKLFKGLDTVEWDNQSSSIMKTILKESFIQNPNALQKLLATNNATLTHTQDRSKWGTEFPKLLMEVREDLSIEPVSTNIRNAEEIYSKLGNKTVSENVKIVDKPYLYSDEQKKGKAIVAYKSTKMPTSFENPFHTSGKTTKENVIDFIDFFLNSNETQAVWMRNKATSGEFKGKPIYYGNTQATKENQPSHATAIDYLINKYDWDQRNGINKNAPEGLPPINRTPKTCE